jgi:hypothetical protein
MLYVARQEGFEEMAEELFQDGVKQVAVHGALINNANEAGKGRYLQYLMVILKMLQSVTLPLSSWGYRWTYSMIGHKVDLSLLHLKFYD